MSIKGIVMDLDGVITDTARYHFLAWKRLADELGFHFTKEDNERLKGVDRMASLGIILEINGAEQKFDAAEKERLAALKNEYYKQFIDKMTEADILENIRDFISDAKAHGLKLAVASVSKNAPFVLERIGLAESFDYIADPASVAHSKPAPDIFAVCATALGLDPCECVGIEDSQAGIQSIHAAGMKSVGINVAVTCLEPDINLMSTSELTVDGVI